MIEKSVYPRYFDLPGILFSRAFCDALGNQDPLDMALHHARIAITRPFEGGKLRKDAAGRALAPGARSTPRHSSRSAKILFRLPGIAETPRYTT